MNAMTGLKPPIMAALYINRSLATTYIGTMAVLVIGIGVIFSILMVFGLFYLIYKVGMFGAFIIGLIFLVIVFAIAVSNDKNEKK